MQWADVSFRLNDLPSTFGRSGLPYVWLQNSYTAGLVIGTQAVDGITQQLTLQNATGNWLNVWGSLFNLPRNADEFDIVYKSRIQITLSLGRGTPVAIQQYSTSILGIAATVSENFATDSWSLNLAGAVSTAQINSLAASLVNVRPAGIPFLPIYIPGGGLYLGSINYLGAPSVTGAFLGSPSTAISPVLSPSTNPAQPLLPSVYLNDPTINPG